MEKFIVQEIREIRVSCEIEAPNATAAINIYKKDNAKHSVSYTEESHVTVMTPDEMLFDTICDAVAGPPEQEEEEW